LGPDGLKPKYHSIQCVIWGGSGQGVNICTSILFPLCGKYPLVTTNKPNKETNKITAWSRVLLEKVTGLQKVFGFYGT